MLITLRKIPPILKGWGEAYRDYGWIIQVLFSIALIGSTVGAFLISGLGRVERHIQVSSITDVTPLQVCQQGKVVVSEPLRGLQYTALWGSYKLSWTMGDDAFGFFFLDAEDYPLIDSRTVDCLERRATLVGPE